MSFTFSITNQKADKTILTLHLNVTYPVKAST
jgi:hypothetical protein